MSRPSKLGTNTERAAANRPVPQKLADMVEAGQLGRKSGQGFYRWENDKAVKPVTGTAAASDEIQDRLILPMVNEAVACLTEGVVEDADLLDAALADQQIPFQDLAIVYQTETHRLTRRAEEQIKEMSQMYLDIIAEIVENGQAEGILRSDLDPGLCAMQILGGNFFYFQSYSMLKFIPEVAFAQDRELYSEAMADILLGGMLAVPGSTEGSS